MTARKPRAAYFAPAIVSARRETPTGLRRRRAASVRVASVRAGTVESGCEHDPALGVSSPCASTSRASSGSCSNPRRKPVAQITCVGAVDRRARRGSAPRPPPARAARPRRGPAGRTARAAAAARRRARGAAGVEGGEAAAARSSGAGTFSGRRSGSRRRTEITSAPAASAFSHSVAAASPAPTTRPRRVLVRLVGVHRARVVGELVRHASPGWPVASRTWRNGPFAVELEAAVDRADPVDPGRHEALVPAARARSSSACVEEVRHGRVVAVATRLEQRRRASGAGTPRARRGRGTRRAAVAVALGAHAALPDRRGPPPPGGGRVGVGAEDGDLLRLDAAVTQRRVGREASQPASDDRAAHVGPTSPSPRAGPARSSAGTRRTRRAERRAR